MKLLIDRKKVENIISILTNYVEKKDLTSINSNIQIKTLDDSLLLRASDTEIGIEYKIKDCQIIENGEIFINPKQFNDILKVLKNDVLIKIEKDNNCINITQEKTNFTLALFQEDRQFNFIENENNKSEIKLSNSEFSKGIKMVNNAIDNSSLSMQFNCCYIEIAKDKCSFVGSDTKRLNVFDIYVNNNEESKIIITKRAVSEISKLLNENVKFYKNNDYFIIENDNFKFFTKNINLDFLRYKEILPPQEASIKVNLNTKQILNELKKLNVVSSRANIVFDNNKIIFSSIKEINQLSQSSVKTEIENNININNNFEINITNKHIIDYLNENDEENFVIEYFAQNSPIILKSTNYYALIAVNKN